MDRRSDNSSMWAIKLPSELSGDEAQDRLAQIAAEHGVPPPNPSFFSRQPLSFFGRLVAAGSAPGC
jgi:hypothetical protein